MITVLRIAGDPQRLREYVDQLNRLSIAAKAHLDRHGRVVADLSKRKSDWSGHIGEVMSALQAFREVLVTVKRCGDTASVDTGLYARSEFPAGIAVTTDCYPYPPDALTLLGELSLTLEVSVSSISPDPEQ